MSKRAIVFVEPETGDEVGAGGPVTAPPSDQGPGAHKQEQGSGGAGGPGPTCPCLDFSMHSGLRYCSCACSDVKRVSLDCEGSKRNVYGPTVDHHAYNGHVGNFTCCTLSQLNVTLEIVAILYAVMVMLIYVLISVFRGLHDAHPALHHVLDIGVPIAVFHAKFHNSVPVVRGAAALTLVALAAKLAFLGGAVYRALERGGGGGQGVESLFCPTFEPCRTHPYIFAASLAVSLALVVLGVYLVYLLWEYGEIVRRARRRVKQALYSK